MYLSSRSSFTPKWELHPQVQISPQKGGFTLKREVSLLRGRFTHKRKLHPYEQPSPERRTFNPKCHQFHSKPSTDGRTYATKRSFYP
jgi:hypothetical protein